MTVLAAWKLLLARYSGQTDIVVGTPIAGRNYTETTHVIGLFVNILVLRSDLSGNPTFAELLARVQQVALGVYAHQDLPFEYLVKELEPERNLSYAPLVQVLCAVHSALPSSEDVGDMPEYWQVGRGAAQFDLSLNLWEVPNGLNGFLEYSSDLFEAATIARMVEQFATLLAGIVAQPHVRLAALPLLSAAEQRQLHAWSTTQATYPTTLSLHQFFEAQAARSPDAVALVFDRGQGSGVRGQGSGDKETRSQESGVRSQESEFLASNPQSPIPNPQSPLHPFTPSPLQHLTYHELNRRANRLAHHLRMLGVGSEVRVGVCMERSLELVVALLGILKAGGAYVPLDPGYPEERLAFMLQDSQAAMLITSNHSDTRRQGDKETRRRGDKALEEPRTKNQEPRDDEELKTQNSKLKTQKSTPSPAHLVTLSRSWSAIALCAADNPIGALDPANLAYIIYTSGSTGQPKGAMNAHAGIVNRLYWMQDAYCLTADDRVLQKTPFSFDVSVWEFFWPLMAGACLVLAQPGGHQDPAYLARLIAQEHITTVHFVPSMLAVFLEEPSVERCAGLRRVICSGEELTAGLQERFFARLGGAPGCDGLQLHNLYGPTEAAVDVTAWACRSGGDQASVPIGRPIANVQIYILDAHCRPVPIGVPGELHIGGVQLARGYLGQPDLTAERFIPNPFGEVLGDGCWVLEDSAPNTQHPTPNTRLYRSGDRARWRAEGTLEYLGRLDEQVKLRGYRVELGEVAAALRQHPAVIDTVVLAREDARGEKRLVAYVVTSHKSQVTSSEDSSLVTRHSLLVTELRDFLKQQLPDYMVPSAFVLLDALPLTAHGKVDQRALPAPMWESQAPAAGFVAPRTPEEALLAQIWADVLGVAQVGVHDNFFALGGHSLLATQVVARVRETFQVELPVRALFETPTVAELAERVALAARTAQGLQIPPLLPVTRDAPLPLSYAQQRLWFLDQLQPFSSAYNLPIALRLTGELDLAALHWSLSELVRRHEALRTTFPTLEGQPVQQIGLPMDVPLPLLDVSALPATEREAVAHQLATAAARRPFDLARGPLLRAALLRLTSADHMLLLSVHHIVADGWSMGVLVTDCMAFYAAASVGHPLSLPALPIQYADYAVWQRAWLQESGVRSQESGVRSQESDGGASQTQNSKLKTQNSPLQAQLGYWRRQLADLPALALPTDCPQPPIQSFRGARQQCVLPGELSAGLMALSRQAGTTLFMTVLAAFQVLLARYTQQDDMPWEHRSPAGRSVRPSI